MSGQNFYHQHCRTMAFIAGRHFDPKEVIFYNDCESCYFMVNGRKIDIKHNSMWALIKRDIEVNLKT